MSVRGQSYALLPPEATAEFAEFVGGVLIDHGLGRSQAPGLGSDSVRAPYAQGRKRPNHAALRSVGGFPIPRQPGAQP